MEPEKPSPGVKSSSGKQASYANVDSSGIESSPVVTLKEVLKHLGPFKLRAPFIWIVGGLANHGKTKGDIDLLIRAGAGELSPELEKVLKWRILRALPAELVERVQFHTDEFHGPFTNNVPLYDLEVSEIADRSVVEMSLSEEVEKAATAQIGRFVQPMKPTMAAEPYERLTLGSFKKSLDEHMAFPALVQKKLDGISSLLWKDGDRTGGFSDDGKVLPKTEAMGPVFEALAALKPKTLMLVGELESWKGKMHLPRDVTSGLVHKKEPLPKGVRVTATVHDSLFIDGEDLTAPRKGEPKDHELEGINSRDRYRVVKGLGLKPLLYLCPSVEAKDTESAVRAAKRMGSLVGSEGAIAKAVGSVYRPGSEASDWLKWRHNVVVTGIVTERVETATKGVFNYQFGFRISPTLPYPKESERTVGGRKVLLSGKTFSTDRRYNPGDRIAIEATTVNWYPETGKVTLWLPRILDDSYRSAKPFAVAHVVEAARREHHVLVVRKGESHDAVTIEKDLDSQSEIAKGGPGSGNWGHAGRKGVRGGSGPGKPSKYTKARQKVRSFEGVLARNPKLAKALVSGGKRGVLDEVADRHGEELANLAYPHFEGRAPTSAERVEFGDRLGDHTADWFMGPSPSTYLMRESDSALAGKVSPEFGTLCAVNAHVERGLGRTSETIHRGVRSREGSKYPKVIEDRFPSRGSVAEIPTRSLSSWSASKSVAQRFGALEGGYLFETKVDFTKDLVPVSHRWGAPGEKEYAVVGKGFRARRSA